MKRPVSKAVCGVVLIVALTGLSGGCGGSDGPASNSPFRGTWVGAYAGDTGGLMTLTVTQKGAWSASMLDGWVTGAVTGAGSVFGSGTFDGHTITVYGTLSSDSHGSGTWSSSSGSSGTWTVSLQA